ncbi:MAG: AAA family ATPase [Treponema sp.]|jgi:exonuclease SbcC|nr:AAA family ATPase [Treponema sp.]
MKPERLVLENFGPFVGRTEIDFSSLEDIFLITGKTGSGKTTIFDAVCFALYGTVPGSRRGHISRLRSDYAMEGNCSVTLDFLLGSRRFRIIRSPKQEKPRKRGSGAVMAEETTELYELKKNPEPVCSRKSEADSKIKELIGLQAEEFFKIVLLPQGEFAEFLRQNTSERQNVLGKLFPVNTAVRIRDLAHERAKEETLRLREAQRILEELRQRVSLDNFEELRTAAEESLKTAKNRNALLAGEKSRLEELLKLVESERRAAGELVEIRRAEETALPEAADLAEREKKLALSRQAQPLRHHLVLEEEKRRSLEQAEADLVRAMEEKAAALEQAEAAEGRKKAAAALEEELLKLREIRPALVRMIAEEEEIRLAREESEKLKTRLLALNRENGLLTRNLHEKDAEITAQQKLSEQVREFELQWEKARDVKDSLVELKEIAAAAETAAAASEAARRRLEETAARRAELERRIPVLQGELETLKREKELGERSRMAVHLAAELKKGEPCPVCGSREHPLPAAAGKPLFDVNERIAAQEHSLKDAEKNLAVAGTEEQSQRREAERLDGEIAALARDAAAVMPAGSIPAALFEGSSMDAAGRIPGSGAVSRLLEEHILKLNAIVSSRDEARRAAVRIAALYREKDEITSVLAAQAKETAGLEEKNKTLEAHVQELQHGHALLAENLSGGINGGGNSAGALEILDERIEELDMEIRSSREAAEQAGRFLAAALAREESCRAQRGEGAVQFQAAASALAEALADSPFADTGALREAALDGETERRLEEEIRRRKDERERIKTAAAGKERALEQIRAGIETCLQQLGRLSIPPGSPAYGSEEGLEAAEIRSRLEDLEAEMAAAETERDRSAAALDALERDAAQLREKTRRYDELTRNATALTGLADDLSGKNPGKKSFDAWLLGLYLAEVAAYATRRLQRMSESRYSLLLDNAGETGRARTGLDLAVFDAYTGKTRPCATLSGGESFMASISLALGLADSIQNRTGGIRLDAVFIDEGFGSLDDATLEKALGILEELRDHRMVGLISHVGEMKSRIPSRIEVVKSGSGSKIRIEKDTDMSPLNI